MWGAGGVLYRGLGRLDAGLGARTWAEALDWLAAFEPRRPIAEIQYWGHGRWGEVRLADEVLSEAALQPGHRHHLRLQALAARLLPGSEGLIWFRTCETFGTAAGHRFARAWSRFFRCRVAGHTYVIGAWQSGLHGLLPDAEPDWPVDEGLAAEGETRGLAVMSHPRAPRTITFLHGRIPEGY